jgi:hypothetical protein
MSSSTHLFRFSLTTLFGAVLFVAFGTAAIRFASPLWAGLTMAVTVPILFAAILGALFRLGQARAFWTGMAVCGWGYLLLVLAPWFETGVGQYLPTSYLLSHVSGTLRADDPVANLTRAYPLIGPARLTMTSSGGGTSSLMLNAIGPATAAGPDSALVLRTGHALFALLFGFIGGVTAKSFYLTRSSREDERSQGVT